MTFEEFKARVQDGIQSGVLKISAELDELDLAIQYSLGMEMEAKGGPPLTISVDDIYDLIGKYCGAETRDRLFAE